MSIGSVFSFALRLSRIVRLAECRARSALGSDGRASSALREATGARASYRRRFLRTLHQLSLSALLRLVDRWLMAGSDLTAGGPPGAGCLHVPVSGCPDELLGRRGVRERALRDNSRETALPVQEDIVRGAVNLLREAPLVLHFPDI